MDRILLVLTGGTICSSKNEKGLNNLDTGMAVPSLVSMYKERCLDSDAQAPKFDIISPINTLSENMTIDKWNQLIRGLREVRYSEYDGIIILHGTDTLHLTSALMDRLLGGIHCPVMMVSANRILDDSASNGLDNFVKSIELIRVLGASSVGGVYVIYRNMDDISYVHHASHLEKCGDYSEDFVSKDMISFDAAISGDSKQWFAAAREYNDALSAIGTLTDNVLYISPYVGLNYDRIGLDGVRAVMHGMYHSSTINTEGDSSTSALSLLRRCNKIGIDFYIFPCESDGYRYSSTQPLIEEGAKCLYGGTWEEAYVELLIRYN